MKHEYKIWWKPNFLDNDFELRVKSVLQGYIALEVCANLDLPNSVTMMEELLNNFPKEHTFINYVKTKYRDYRRQNSINGAWLITDNMGGLTVKEDGEWVDWVDPEYGDDVQTFVSMLCNDIHVDISEELKKFN